MNFYGNQPSLSINNDVSFTPLNFLAGLIYAFARSMTTISAIIFLTTPQTKIMTQQILNEVENGRYGNAFAYCVILIGIVMVAISVLYFLVGSTTGTEQRIEGGL